MSALLSVAAGGARGAEPGPPAQTTQPGARLLADVPYIAQSGNLCGGAALAMVLRYWGTRQIYAEDFAALVDEAKGGIETVALEEAANGRGYQPVAFNGTLADLEHHLSRGRPVVVLLRDSPIRYHYVVVIGVFGGGIVFHDPARAPFRRMDASRFDAMWSASGRWALLVLPRHDRDPDSSAASVGQTSDLLNARPPRPPGACSELVEKAVADAHANSLESAERALTTALQRCPGDPAPARELAGLRLLQKRWREAHSLASRAVTLDPDDRHAWNLLASSQYLEGDRDGALAAWNVVGTPKLDLVQIDGLDRLPHRTVAGSITLDRGSILTAGQLRHARRRLGELPAIQSGSLTYEPASNGLADVRARVVERPLIERSAMALVQTGVRAALDREVTVRVANPLRAGELWAANWRWWPERQRAGLALSTPRPSGLPGVWTIEGLWDRQAYAALDGSSFDASPATREERRRGSIRVDDWIHPVLRVSARAALDRWNDGRLTYALGGGPQVRLLDDRGAVKLDGEWWLSGSRFSRVAVDSSWRVTSERSRAFQAFARGGVQVASQDAPLALWPAAGATQGRGTLLRAHPLLDEGVIRGEAFGRELAYATIEAQRWRQAAGALRLGGAVFVDAARVWSRQDASDSPLLVDAGIGVRLGFAGSDTHIRLDVARSLTDGRTTLSAGWVAPWPAW